MTKPVGYEIATRYNLRRGPIAEQFDILENEKRSKHRLRMNEIARLVMPSLEWHDNENHDNDHKYSHQVRNNTGSDGLAALRGRTIDIVFPPNENPFSFDFSMPLRSTADERRQVEEHFNRERHRIWTLLSTAQLNHRLARRGQRIQHAISDIVNYSSVHGDTCVRMNKDMTLSVYHPRQWVCIRDDQGNVTRIITCVRVQAELLPDNIKEKADFPADFMRDDAGDREKRCDVYADYVFTSNGTWELTEEINGNVVHRETHSEARIYSVPCVLVRGETYGRSFFDSDRGKLNELEENLVARSTLVAACADLKIAIDPGAAFSSQLLTGPSGSFIEGARVGSDGKSMDVGVISIDKSRELAQIDSQIERLEMSLAAKYGLVPKIMPTQDRTTREQVIETANWVRTVNGGQLLSFVESLTHQMFIAATDVYYSHIVKPKDVPPVVAKIIKDQDFKLRFLTGERVIARSVEVNKIATWTQAVQTIASASQAMPQLNVKAVAKRIAESLGLSKYEDLMFSDEEIQARQQQQIQNQALEAGAVALAEQGARSIAPQIPQ